MRQRLCICTDSTEPSGVGEHMLALANGLAAPAFRHAWEVTVAAGGSDGARALLQRCTAAGIAVASVPETQARTRTWLGDSGFAVVHVHAGIGWEGHGLAAAARDAEVPVVIRSEHLPYLITDAAQAASHARGVALVDRVVCVSEAAAASHAAAGIRRGQLAVVRNGIPAVMPRQSRAEVRTALGIDADDPVIVTVARFTEQKGHAVLLHAAPAIRAAWPRVRFLLVGSGEMEAGLRRMAEGDALHGCVSFLGQRDDVPDLLHAADLFLLPSLFEGLPLAVLEAMSAGLPVVASRIGGTDEAVIDGETGWLFAPGDAGGLARCVIAALADHGLARRAGDAGRLRHCREFRLERMVKQMHQLYLEPHAQPAPARAERRA